MRGQQFPTESHIDLKNLQVNPSMLGDLPFFIEDKALKRSSLGSGESN
jgi:hypothetical protein